MNKNPQILAKKLNLVFNQYQLFDLALTHRSVGIKNNERLEYLGDSVLGFIIAKKLYEMFPNAKEGDLSRLRASMVNQRSLAVLAKEHNIGDYLILGDGEIKNKGYKKDSILSNTLEAIMGAILQDQGVQVCQNWVLDIFNKRLLKLDVNNWQKDYKTKLQELMQAKKNTLPIYKLEQTTGEYHAQTFSVICKTIMSKQTSIGRGVSIKKAEQEAAEKMLKLINQQNQ